MDRLRIAHYGTGDTGMRALRLIAKRPELELVGLLVHTPAKVGRDAGEIADIAPTGVTAIADFDAFLKLDADCVTYFATDYGRDRSDVIEEMCRILASGKNIVTTSYVSLTYPAVIPAEHRTRLEEACAQGGTSLFCTGLTPGFTGDVLTLMASSVSSGIDTIAMSERVLSSTYPDPITFQLLGYGKTPEEDARFFPQELAEGACKASVQMVADALGIELDEIRGTKRVALADADYEVEAGKIPKGTICSLALSTEGIVGGRVRISVTQVLPMTEDHDDGFEPKMPPGSRSRHIVRVSIKGEPDLDLNLAFEGSDLPGALATVARAINAIGGVCAAEPGLLNGFDLPFEARGAMAI